MSVKLSRVCTIVCTLLAVLCIFIMPAFAVNRPVDAIPKMRPDSLYVVGQISEVRELAGRLSRSEFFRTVLKETRFNEFVAFLRSPHVEKAAFYVEIPETRSLRSARFGVIFSFDSGARDILNKIEKGTATKEEIDAFLLLGAKGEKPNLFDVTARKNDEKFFYSLPVLGLNSMEARGNLLLFSNSQEAPLHALNRRSGRYTERVKVNGDNTIVMQMGAKMAGKLASRFVRQKDADWAKAFRFEAGLRLREDGWELDCYTNAADFIMEPEVAKKLSSPVGSHSFVSLGGGQPLFALNAHPNISYLKKWIRLGQELDNTNRRRAATSSPGDINNAFYATAVLMFLDGIQNMNIAVIADASSALGVRPYFAITTSDADAVSVMRKHLDIYLKLQDKIKWSEVSVPGWDAVYRVDLEERMPEELTIAFRGNQGLVGWISPESLNLPLENVAPMLSSYMDNSKLSEFIYTDVASIRALLEKTLISPETQEQWNLRLRPRSEFALRKMLASVSDIREMGVEVSSVYRFLLRCVTERPSLEERLRLLSDL